MTNDQRKIREAFDAAIDDLQDDIKKGRAQVTKIVAAGMINKDSTEYRVGKLDGITVADADTIERMKVLKEAMVEAWQDGPPWVQVVVQLDERIERALKALERIADALEK